MTDQAPNLSWIQKHGKWLGAMVVVGMGLAYVLQQVNPETVMMFRVAEAKVQLKTEIRWCLTKLAWSNNLSRVAVLECAD